MTQEISISDETFARLQILAKPFVDTPETVIKRLLDACMADTSVAAIDGYKVFDGAAPPNLMHTTVQMAIVNGVRLRPAETYWNTILVVLVRNLAKTGMTPENIKACVIGNSMVGEHSTNGYKFIPEAGISVQGLDANNAWKSIYFLAMASNQEVEVRFRWQDKEGAANAGVAGVIGFKQKKAA